MRFLCLDYGQERTGLAVSDPDGRLAFPLCTVRLSDFPDRKAQLDAIALMAQNERAEALVLGLPLSADGAETESCARVRNLVPRLRRRLGLPIFLMDEHLSSDEAESGLKALGLAGRRRREVLDQQAAVLILESFLRLAPEKRTLA